MKLIVPFDIRMFTSLSDFAESFNVEPMYTISLTCYWPSISASNVRFHCHHFGLIMTVALPGFS